METRVSTECDWATRLTRPPELDLWFLAQFDDKGRPLPGTPASLGPWLRDVATHQLNYEDNCTGGVSP